MTLSNFDWTDKASVKWFIILPTGHEGPYSLSSLKKRSSHDLKVWAEGLDAPVSLKTVLQNAEHPPKSFDGPAGLPPLPIDDEIPPLPSFNSAPKIEVEKEEVKLGKPIPKSLGILVGGGLLCIFVFFQWMDSKETISIRRLAKMSPELHQRINSDLRFESWDKKIFFKEYVSTDLSLVWLTTSSFQECEVEANFSSIKGKLLSNQDERVSFKSHGVLKDHLVEFSAFDFTTGSKVIPGMYEIDIQAQKCTWGSLVAKLGNQFSSADDNYVARMKVILYPRGADEFNAVLEKMLLRKTKLELEKEAQEELFWQDVQQKFQTLLAITLQIENHFLEFLEKDPKFFQKNLKPMVEMYTKKYGHFLTKLVIANEEYFQDLIKTNIANLGVKKLYEPEIRLVGKQIGLESMKIIESLQKLKKPGKKDLARIAEKSKKSFVTLKGDLNKKILKLTEDRAH